MTLEDAVYTADDAGNVIAFDAPSGVERWRYSLADDDGAGQVRGIAPGDGLVYAASAKGWSPSRSQTGRARGDTG